MSRPSGQRSGLTKAAESVAISQLEKAVGGRAKMAAALDHAPASEELALITGFLADPRNDTATLGELCRNAGMTLPQLWGLFRDAVFSKAQIHAIVKIAAQAPAVADDVMKRAVEHEVVCEMCFGYRPRRGKKYRRCQGVGFVKVAPTVKRQEMALELAGLLKRGCGGVTVGVNVHQQVQQVNVPAAFAKFQHASDRILYGDGRVVVPTVSEEPTS